eukprot:gene10896-1979_t
MEPEHNACLSSVLPAANEQPTLHDAPPPIRGPGSAAGTSTPTTVYSEGLGMKHESALDQSVDGSRSQASGPEISGDDLSAAAPVPDCLVESEQGGQPPGSWSRLQAAAEQLQAAAAELQHAESAAEVVRLKAELQGLKEAAARQGSAVESAEAAAFQARHDLDHEREKASLMMVALGSARSKASAYEQDVHLLQPQLYSLQEELEAARQSKPAVEADLWAQNNALKVALGSARNKSSDYEQDVHLLHPQLWSLQEELEVARAEAAAREQVVQLLDSNVSSLQKELHDLHNRQLTCMAWGVPNPAVTNKALVGHSNAVNCVASSPDGQYIASGSSDNTIRVWTAATGELVRELTGHTSHVWSVCFSPDGQYIASGSHDKTIRVWTAATGELVRELTGHTDSVGSVCFSPDGQYIASGSCDKTIRVWTAATGELVRELAGHTDSVWSVCFSPDGQYIASGSRDKTIRVWRSDHQGLPPAGRCYT